MVENTLGRWLEGKTVRQAAGIKILDPACGSGTFLIRCYQYLIDWHLKAYQADPKTYKNRIRRGPRGALLLTGDERKRILLRNVFGVDKDEQAVETTKLSLLLKVLEGETAESIRQQLSFLKERALPDLERNIKCGNSLIESDYFKNRNLAQVSEEELKSIKPFDWTSDFLKELKVTGFDVVIGNPPYIFTREQIPDYEREYFTKKFSSSFDKHNTFALFTELMSRLLTAHGRGSFIVPNSLLTIPSLDKLRAMLVPKLLFVTDLNYTVFEKVQMEPCIFGIRGSAVAGPVDVSRVYSRPQLETAPFACVSRSSFNGKGHRIAFQIRSGATEVLDRVLLSCGHVGTPPFDVRSGLQAYERGKGAPPQTAADVKDHVFDRTRRVDRNSNRYLEGADVGRYRLAWSGLWMQYGRWLAQPRTIDIFTRPRVLVREITSKFPRSINAVFVSDKYLNNKSVLNILHDADDEDELLVLTAVLNSRFLSLFYKEKAVKSARKLFPKILANNLREFPYPSNLSPKVKGQLRDCAVDLARVVEELQKPDQAQPTRTRAERRAELLERRIDELVYAAFGLTVSEIAIVEDARYGEANLDEAM
jgi:hypothetical protein